MTSTTPNPTVPSAPTPSAPTVVPSAGILSVLSVVAGVVSVAFGQIFFLPITAIVLGVLGRRREPQSRVLATVGIVLGVVMLLGWIVLLLLGVGILGPLALLGHAIHGM